jgi:hypothetical protein
LRLKLEEEIGKRPSQAELRSTCDRLEVYALDAPVDDVHVRVALAGGRVFIDLADDRGRVVEVGPDGWEVIDNAPVHFVRPASLRPLPVPEKGGSIGDLRLLINVGDDGDFVLIVAFLLDALRNDGAHPILVINGGEGTAKSTLVEILQALIDPSWARLDGLPNTERQFKAAEGYLRPYDNVSSISAKISDALCRLSTGRPAYPIILNGIDNLVMRPELADRCLFVNLAPVSDRQRRSQQEISRTTFEEMRPQILGVLLDAVAQGLHSVPTTQLNELPRMADFALWATACEGALWPEGTFMPAYLDNRAEAAERLIETDVVATAVQAFMANRATWSGTATELDTTLRMAAGNLEGTKGWPALPQFLAARLRALASSLGKTGIDVTTAKVGHDRKRVITLSRIVERPDPPNDGSRLSTSGNENVCPGTGGADDAEPETEKAVDTSSLADGADAAHAADAVDEEVTRSSLADAADAADAADDEIRTSSFADAADVAHAAADAVDEEVPTSTFADAADGELVDKTTMLVGGVLKEDRCIPVYWRRSRKRHKLGNLERPENLVQPDLYETDRRYDADAERVLEAAITEGLEQIERTVPSAS